MDSAYDVLVVGSGIAGSSLAMVLSRQGLKTLVIERKSHPRFVIGESTIPTTTLLLNSLARTYQVPELHQIGHYLGLRENKCAAWPKQLFWYGVHSEGQPLPQRSEALFETLHLPNGPDVHMLRADADGFLVSRLGKYGVDYSDHTDLVGFEAQKDGARVKLRTKAGDHEIHAKLVVDATGHASYFAKRYGLRDADARLHTNTRSIFSHVKGLPDLDECLGGTNPNYRFRRTAGTMHHCFKGGWIWVIPFDNEITSVGYVLDRDIYPLDESIPVEEEIARLHARFPSMKAHLGNVTPIFPWIRTDRIQFTSKTIIGDKFVMTPHAAGFIDPLFSTGILLTLSFITRFAPVAKDVISSGNIDMEQFRPIEKAFFTEIEQIDRIVSGVIRSFRHPDLFKQYWRNWIIGSAAQLCFGMVTRGKLPLSPVLYGSGVEEYRTDLRKMHELVYKAEDDDVTTANKVKDLVDKWHKRLCDPAIEMNCEWVVGTERSFAAQANNNQLVFAAWIRKIIQEHGLDPAKSTQNALLWSTQTSQKMQEQLERYRKSRAEGDDFHRAFERILANQNPATFDYAKAIKLVR